MRSAVRYFDNAKDRPLDSNLDPSKPSLADSFRLYCSFKRKPSITPITVDIDTLHDFFRDSESLLKRIQGAITRSWASPSHCLVSDYNLESGIVDIIATPGISFKYQHIKSHQDDATEIHLLPWTAQMNVHPDTLATDSTTTLRTI